MDRIEHSASPIEWYQWLLCASGSITIEWVARVSQWDSFHHKCREWRELKSTDLRVGDLSSSHSSKVYNGWLTREDSVGFNA